VGQNIITDQGKYVLMHHLPMGDTQAVFKKATAEFVNNTKDNILLAV
jgi:hypothetical protein